MNLSPMKFRDFIWPHNPTSCTMTGRRRTAVHEIPFGGVAVQDLGPACRIMEGQGEFTGPEAYLQFRRLAALFESGTPGLLIHPVWPVLYAVPETLRLTQEPRANYVSYAFSFREYPTSAASGSFTQTEETAGSARYHTVSPGETLWTVAQRYSTTVSALCDLNPDIKNPGELTPGTKVQVSR